MSQKISKLIGEGGAHAHKIADVMTTLKDGIHKHLFFINERLIMTELDGAHDHSINTRDNIVRPEYGHEHVIQLKTSEGVAAFKTNNGQDHTHELQSNITTLSGVHTHMVEMGGESYISMVPSDLIEEIEEEKIKLDTVKQIKLSRDLQYPIEMDFSLVKKLNMSNFKDVLVKSVVKNIIKQLTRISEGLMIESLILSRERFSDIGEATRFVLDNGLNVKQSNSIESEGIFTFKIMSKEAFDEATFQRIRITEGVEAVIGFLKEDAIQNQKQNEGEINTTINEATDMQKVLIPSDDMTREQLRQSLQQRSEKFGIEITSDAALTFPANFPTDLAMFGDPVNFLYPFDTEPRARNARVRFKQFADETYDMEKSKKVVHNRIVERELELGIKASFDENDKLDQLLSPELKSKLKELNSKLSLSEMAKKVFEKYDCETEKGCGEKPKKKEEEDEDKEDERIKPKPSRPASMGVRGIADKKKAQFETLTKSEEKRLIFGPVLIPESIDLQDDIVSESDIELAAHNYMVKLAFKDDKEFLQSLGLNDKSERGFMHSDFSKKMAVVENYIAPVEFEVNKRVIKKGTWLMTMKVFDDETWSLIKAGKITGFSIGGQAKSIIEE